MVSDKSAAKTRHPNKIWTHTKKNPTASRNNGKWRLGANFYARLTQKTGKMKYTTDEKFSSDFGSPFCANGRYDTKEEAVKDIAKFRAALEFVDQRDSQGGNHVTVQKFSSPTRFSPRVTHAEQDDQDAVIKTVLESIIVRVEINLRRDSVKVAALKRSSSFKFFSTPKLRTARYVRLRKFKAARRQSFSSTLKARLKMDSKTKNALAQR
jgi:hypothetical protein